MKEFEEILETSRKMKWYNADFTVSDLADCEFENSGESSWSDKQASSFIESMFLGIPVPQLYLKNNNTGKRWIIDGVNRIDAIQRFVKGDLALAPEGISFLECLKGTSYKSVPGWYARRFNDYMLRAVITESSAPDYLCEMLRSKLNGGL